MKASGGIEHCLYIATCSSQELREATPTYTKLMKVPSQVLKNMTGLLSEAILLLVFILAGLAHVQLLPLSMCTCGSAYVAIHGTQVFTCTYIYTFTMFMFNKWVCIHRHVHLNLFTCRCTDVHGNTGKRLFAQTQPDRNKWCDAQHQCLKAPIPKMIGLAELGSVASAESSMTFEAAQSLADKVDQLAAEAIGIKQWSAGCLAAARRPRLCSK